MWAPPTHPKRRPSKKNRECDKTPNGCPPRSPYREVVLEPIATRCTHWHSSIPCQPVYYRPRGELSSGLRWGAVGTGFYYRRRASFGMPSKRVAATGRFRGAAHHGTARRRRTTPQDQLNTPVHWARWTVRQQLTLRTSGAIIRQGAIIRSLLVKRKQEYHEACPPNVLTAVCRSGASQVGHCLHLSVERFGYGCTFWCVYVSSCFSLVLGGRSRRGTTELASGLPRGHKQQGQLFASSEGSPQSNPYFQTGARTRSSRLRSLARCAPARTV